MEKNWSLYGCNGGQKDLLVVLVLNCYCNIIIVTHHSPTLCIPLVYLNLLPWWSASTPSKLPHYTLKTLKVTLILNKNNQIK